MDSGSVIAAGATLRASIEGQEPLRVHGRIEGDVSLQSVLVIESDGLIIGDISAAEIDVAGAVRGVLRAGRITVRSSARIIGEIDAGRLAIEAGARIKGQVKTDSTSDVPHRVPVPEPVPKREQERERRIDPLPLRREPTRRPAPAAEGDRVRAEHVSTPPTPAAPRRDSHIERATERPRKRRLIVRTRRKPESS